MKVVILTLAIVAQCFAGFTWSSCGTGHFKADSVVMAPYPAVRGQNVTTHAHGVQDETVTGGTWSTTVYKYGVPLQTDSGKSCDLIPNCPCPCPAGTYTSSQTLTVPSFAPSGDYTGTFKAVDQNGNLLTCINYAFAIA
eukprot:TRINITY_DN697_c0_g1_i1.p1 TRINITY_DN697_c0_g1~~TRINITY_DN697_c0_g1_i1.p1  ORF type:complete len:139 (-),score=24.86 TRINITY_DN697_c0_g1_i1:50-466(-)